MCCVITLCTESVEHNSSQLGGCGSELSMLLEHFSHYLALIFIDSNSHTGTGEHAGGVLHTLGGILGRKISVYGIIYTIFELNKWRAVYLSMCGCVLYIFPCVLSTGLHVTS